MGPGPAGEALARAFSSGARLLDFHADSVHGRTVLTLAGSDRELAEALLAGAEAAIERIDLRAHVGAHPRIGALDVCPVVYVAGQGAGRVAEEGRARRLAAELASGLAELGLPVFLYGELARSPERRERHYFRVGGPERLAQRMAAGELEADIGPSDPHPTAGAVLVTARPPLAAFNVEVEGVDLEAARSLAGELRESGGGLVGVRALAINLGDGRIQISTNVHDPHGGALPEVVAEVRRLAAVRGGRPVGAELVGLVPERALAGYPGDVPISGADPHTRTIEARLGELTGT